MGEVMRETKISKGGSHTEDGVTGRKKHHESMKKKRHESMRY